MAEMTAVFAQSTVKLIADQLAAGYRRYGTAEELRKVAALIQQQAAEIEQLKADKLTMRNCYNCANNGTGRDQCDECFAVSNWATIGGN